MSHSLKGFRVLSMWEVDDAFGIYDPLVELAEVETHPPDYDYLLSSIAEFDAYLATLHVRFDRQIIERASDGKLRVVSTPSTGLDHLDLQALEEFGIELLSLKTEFELLDQITATAELAFALMLSAARRIPSACNAAMRGHWARDEFRGHQLSGKTLGVLGVGRLGSMMVEFGRGLRMNVIGCDPNPRNRIADLEYLDFDEFAARSDVISVHIHLTSENEHFLNADRIAKMKDGVILVNTSRGATIDEAALLAALESGKVGGLGADVIDGEWRTDLENHSLIEYARTHENAVITPHIGGVTHESQAATQAFVVKKLADKMRSWH